jgi:hypothetical protein
VWHLARKLSAARIICRAPVHYPLPLKVYFCSDSQRKSAAGNLFPSWVPPFSKHSAHGRDERALTAGSAHPRLRPVSKLYLLLLVCGVLVTLVWITVLAWAAISLAQHIF